MVFAVLRFRNSKNSLPLDLPRDSEIIFPAPTFWAVPEMARVLGFRPKFVDIDPGTFNLDPAKYCIRAADPATLKLRAIRAGVDVETMHVDICNVLNHFDPFKTKCPVAEAAEHTLQLPVYAPLTEKDLDRIIRVIRAATGPSRQLLTGTAQRYN